MHRDRYLELERNQELQLTPEERGEGWHFCFDWDGMLVNRYDTEGEGAACTCFARDEKEQKHD